MTAPLLHVLPNLTGIPATGAAVVETQGEAYREYQHATTTFFPGPPRPRH